ncbi:MAG: hypothetical protein U0354_16915 [Candidatus Sericytochromatia bacterium]
MKKIIYLCLLLIYCCEAQPNRPLTAIDKMERISKIPLSINTPSPNPTISAEPNIVKVVFKGQISDFETRLPLANVNLTIDNVKSQTDINGKFLIPDFSTGSHEFIAIKEGYMDYISTMNIKSDFGSVYIFMKKKI